MISVTVRCNTPVSFSLKEWDIYFPRPLCLIEEEDGGGDLNKGLFEKPVVEGEELFFGFRCRRLRSNRSHSHTRLSCNNADGDDDERNDEENGTNKDDMNKRGSLIPINDANNNDTTSSSTNANRPVLHVTLKDKFDKTFRQVLPLDHLDNLYDRMQREDDEQRSSSSSNISNGNSSSAGMICATATLMCAVNQGLVGAPVSFTYRIDITTTSTTGSGDGQQISRQHRHRRQLLYQISCARGDWIVGGKIRGSIDVVLSSCEDGETKEDDRTITTTATTATTATTTTTHSFDLKFVGVPSKAGVLKRFPDVKLSYLPLSLEDDDNDYDATVSSHFSTTMVQQQPRLEVRSRHPDSFMALAYKSHMALACLTRSI